VTTARAQLQAPTGRRPAGEPLLDVSSAAARLCVPVRFIRRLVAERRLPFVKVGRYVRFRTEDIDAFIAAATVQPPHLH